MAERLARPWTHCDRLLPWLLSLWVTLGLFGVASAQITQTIKITNVANSADFQPVLPQPGSLASIFLTGLAGEAGIITATKYPLSNELNGITVFIESRPAPILALAFLDSYQQINIQVPWEHTYNPLNPQSTVEVRQNGVVARFQVTQATAPTSVFFTDANGYGVLQHASDYSLVTPENPAHRGEYLVAYAINLGFIKNQPQTGAPAPFDPLATVYNPFLCVLEWSLQIGTATANPSFLGLTPGTVGVSQVNFQLPESAPVGDQPLSFVWTTSGGGGGFSQCRYGQATSRTVKLPIR